MRQIATLVGLSLLLAAVAVADLGILYQPSPTPGAGLTRFYGCEDATCVLSDFLGQQDCPNPLGCYVTVPSTPAAVFATAVSNGFPESSPSEVWIVGQAPTTSTTTPTTPTTSTSTGPAPTTSTSVATPSTTSTTLATTALLAAYGFEEASGTTLTDTSGNGRHGSLGGAARTTTGRYGRGLVTTNGIGTAPAPGLVRTAMAWVQPTAVNTGWRCPLSNWNGGAAWYLCLTNAEAGPGTYNGMTYQEAIGGAFQAGVWTHLAATYDGSTIRAYVNGVQVASVASTVTPSSTAALLFGETYSGERFAGALDEVRLYSTVRTAAQIVADMNAPVASPAPTTTTLAVPTTSSTTSTSSTSSSSTSSSSTSTSTSTTTTATRLCAWPAEQACPAF